jgi:hypothetical protein
MSYEEEIILVIAQIALMKQRLYELRRRAMVESRDELKRPYYRQGADELIQVLCGLTSAQVRLGVAQCSFAIARAVGGDEV